MGGQRIVVPDAIVRMLASYQRVGVRWLLEKLTAAADGGGAGVLGDAPGLGKTVQAIAVVAALVAGGLTRRVLVVAPANVVTVWAAEFQKFAAGALSVSVAGDSGGGGRGLRALATAESLLARLAAVEDDALVVVVSFEQMVLHSADFVASGTKLDLLIVDEAHRLKNHKSQAARGFNKMGRRASLRPPRRRAARNLARCSARGMR